MDLMTRFSSVVVRMAPTGCRRCAVLIPRNSIENSLQKLVKKFDCDPTVGSIVMDLWTRFSYAVGGMAPTGLRKPVVPIPLNSIEHSLRITREKNLSAIQRSDL